MRKKLTRFRPQSFALALLLLSATTKMAFASEDPAICGLLAPDELRPGAEPVSVMVTVCNVGDSVGEANATWRLTVEIDSLGTSPPIKYVLADTSVIGLPGPGEFILFDLPVRAPASGRAGSYRWRATLIPLDHIADEDFQNNSEVGTTLRLRGIDLYAMHMEGPAEVAAGDTAVVFYALANRGTVTAGPFRIRFGLARSAISGDDEIVWMMESSDVLELSLAPTIFVFSTGHAVIIPEDLPPGAWVWIIDLDPDNAVVEEDETNNRMAGNATVPSLPVSWGSLKRRYAH